ncbi:hypothetical protein B0H94_1042 [Salsuginibacillus halophilus]|uniref:Heme-binding protein Shr-like Hb-interacting domain-containing protein n=1 Tax=Salsuginibacillus halophilus TaxID=517424 RepID=A0A2P8HQB9_9BACI|nr:hypothetical protein [Salsuginibacillus halophilus]PSL48402.1 hypothetical protein B0H94_1042 [Salsuginibacillus halophilus]
MDSDLEILFDDDELTADYQNAVTAVELDNDNGTEITVSEEDYDFNVDSGDTTLTIDEGVVENADEYDLTIVADNYENIEEDDLEVVEGAVNASQTTVESSSLTIDVGDSETFVITAKDKYGNPVDINSGDISLLHETGGAAVDTEYDWIETVSVDEVHGDSNQVEVTIDAHATNTGSANDIVIEVDSVGVKDDFEITVEDSAE